MPHFPSALTSGNVEPNPMEVLSCFVNHLDKVKRRRERVPERTS